MTVLPTLEEKGREEERVGICQSISRLTLRRMSLGEYARPVRLVCDFEPSR